MPSSSTVIAVASTVVVLPMAYMAYFSHNIRSSTISSTGIYQTKRSRHETEENTVNSTPLEPLGLPGEVLSDAEWILAYERVVSHPVSEASLALQPLPSATETTDSGSSLSLSPLLRRYASAAQLAFGKTPQAWLMQSLLGQEARKTFDAAWIQETAFNPGDVVNGVYKVSYRGPGRQTGSERVELAIEAPPSYTGHVPRGIIASEVKRTGNGHLLFINETWMWRRTSEKPTLIESPFGAWLHTLMAGWLVMKGIGAVRATAGC